MDNIITINLKETEEGKHDYAVTFESNPTLSELVAGYLILKITLENNFDQALIYNQCSAIYNRISDIEEVLRV